MKRLILIILTCAALVVPAAAEVSTHDITNIIPGNAWQLLAKFQQAPGVPLETQGKNYIAYFSSAPPLIEQTYASFSVDVSTVNQGAILMQLTPRQTRALAGKHGRWLLVYIPDLGAPQVISTGSVVVRAK